jgi:uncharacterized protein
MTASESPSAAMKPVVRARRIRFSYPTGSLQRHFVGGDLVMSNSSRICRRCFPRAKTSSCVRCDVSPTRSPIPS